MDFGRADLHTHTLCSDGRLAPAELVARAHGVGLRALAITDHDSVDGLAEGRAAADRLGIELVPGVELSAAVGGEEVHLLGYCFDPAHPELRQYLGRFRAERRTRAERMVELLNRLDVPLTFDEVLAHAGRGAVGRPHVARALVSGGHVSEYREAFLRYIGNHGPAYVPHASCTADQAIGLLRAAGGISVLAHPGIWVSATALSHLIDAGMDGIETVHPSHDAELTRYYHEIARDFRLLETGGSDYHGFRDTDEEHFGRYTIPAERLKKLRMADSGMAGWKSR